MSAVSRIDGSLYEPPTRSWRDSCANASPWAPRPSTSATCGAAWMTPALRSRSPRRARRPGAQRSGRRRRLVDRRRQGDRGGHGPAVL